MHDGVEAFRLRITNDIDTCDVIRCRTSAILRIYPPDTSDLTSVALYAGPTKDGPWSPVKERDPSDHTAQIEVEIPISLPGNFAFPPSTYDTIYRKVVGTFGMASEETIPATCK